MDIKPENILKFGPDIYKITDFGLSKFTRQEAASSSFSRFGGTTNYLSP
jgi:serine/threonine protein kinase